MSTMIVMPGEKMSATGGWDADNASQLQHAITGAEEVLRFARNAQWKLPAEKWDEFDGGMTILARALADRDAAAIRQAADKLARAEPRRIIRLGSGDPAVSMPEPTRERLNEVVHSIDRLRSGGTGQAGDTDLSPGSESGRT